MAYTNDIIKLCKVTPENNNKMYILHPVESDTWKAEWYRVGKGSQSKLFPKEKRLSKFNEQIREGYVQINSVEETELKVTINVSKFSNDISKSILEELFSFTKATVSKNYKTAEKTTASQVSECNRLLLEIYNDINSDTFNKDTSNKKLTRIYSIIPRSMSDVRHYLLDDNNKINLELLSKEKSLLDSLDSTLEVSVIGLENDYNHLTFNESNNKEVYELVSKQLYDRLSIDKIYDINYEFPYNEGVKLLWHGSRNENWFSIITNGLRIRPSNAIYNGSMFGDGIYFADRMVKSIGYTSLEGSKWANGNNNFAYLGLYKVYTGKEYKVIPRNYREYNYLNYEHISKNNYNSTFAVSEKIDNNSVLKMNEYIIYKEEQCKLAHIIKIKKS